MNQTKTLPIFPLDLVVFPHQLIPLRIFEPRYKQLIDDAILAGGQFGICLVNPGKTIQGWDAPESIGTIVKITKCQDLELGEQLLVQTKGQQKFKIEKIIVPSLKIPDNYDPFTHEGQRKIWDLHVESGTEKKMYISAQVRIIPEIEESIPLEKWEKLIELWKNKIIYESLPKLVNPLMLDQVLVNYGMSDLPTIDHVYLLATLGAKNPHELQPILEAMTIEDLFLQVEKLFLVN